MTELYEQHEQHGDGEYRGEDARTEDQKRQLREALDSISPVCVELFPMNTKGDLCSKLGIPEGSKLNINLLPHELQTDIANTMDSESGVDINDIMSALGIGSYNMFSGKNLFRYIKLYGGTYIGYFYGFGHSCEFTILPIDGSNGDDIQALVEHNPIVFYTDPESGKYKV